LKVHLVHYLNSKRWVLRDLGVLLVLMWFANPTVMVTVDC
jgi:hypothetical protein